MGVLGILSLASSDGSGSVGSIMSLVPRVTDTAHDAHPSIDHLILLVFEAVMEVVCVSLPGYIIARLGGFDAEKQKFLANLNVMLFTPALIFTKLASQLSVDKLAGLAVIPVIFIIQTMVSYLVATVVSKCFRFGRRPSNFVKAMGVFGNSNSLPISLVISLSQTLPGLKWDKVPKDSSDEIAARGILYLLVFQQLGQLVRWSWGYHVLLAPKDKYEEYASSNAEEGCYRDEVSDADGTESVADSKKRKHHRSPTVLSDASGGYEPAGRTPVAGSSRATPLDSDAESDTSSLKNHSSMNLGHVHKSHSHSHKHSHKGPQPNHGSIGGQDDVTVIQSFPRVRSTDEPEIPPGFKGFRIRARLHFQRSWAHASNWMLHASRRTYFALPRPLQATVNGVVTVWAKFKSFVWEFMNPPLWAMLAAVLVASTTSLQHLFFDQGTFVKNSVTSAFQSLAGVAVPLILVVLGANLARNTQKREGADADPEEKEIGSRLLVASLISRMLLPMLIMGPIIALFAKFVPVSILGDPIFIVVAFLLTGAPSALQLAQICQLNSVYEITMGTILFQSYVVWILPSTLVLVMSALEVVEWSKPI